MAAAQRTVAQLHPFVEDLPEGVHVSMGRQADVHQVHRHHALIEATVVFVLCGIVVPGVGDVAQALVGEAVRRQETAAAHAGVHIAALQLLHDLFGDVIRHHALGGALRRQLCKVIVPAVLVDIVLLQHID